MVTGNALFSPPRIFSERLKCGFICGIIGARRIWDDAPDPAGFIDKSPESFLCRINTRTMEIRTIQFPEEFYSIDNRIFPARNGNLPTDNGHGSLPSTNPSGRLTALYDTSEEWLPCDLCAGVVFQGQYEAEGPCVPTARRHSERAAPGAACEYTGNGSHVVYPA